MIGTQSQRRVHELVRQAKELYTELSSSKMLLNYSQENHNDCVLRLAKMIQDEGLANKKTHA